MEVNARDGTIGLYLGNGDGTFGAETPFPSNGGTGGIVSGDFNLDGKVDVVLLAGPNISVIAGNGDGTFRPPVEFAVGMTAETAGSEAVVDINGDGAPDLVVTVHQTLFVPPQYVKILTNSVGP